ncbi:MAG: transcription elongation factor GreA [Chloroflexi bacterium]|nr:transcription elongation factor GreA [Chloroflexota bacterium]
MTQQRETYLTPEGEQKLREELEHLRTVRSREVADRLRRAAEVGGTVDNAEYDEASREQAMVAGRIREVETILKHAVLISGAPGREVVNVGSRVTLKDEQGRSVQYTIVGSPEADPAHGRISNESPVGKALLGRRKGESVQARAPGGIVTYKIVKIE